MQTNILAQRSALAAKEIKQLIGDSVSRVDAGSRRAHYRSVKWRAAKSRRTFPPVPDARPDCLIRLKLA